MRVRLHPHEADRLTSLRSYGVLDSEPDPAFDALTRLAGQVCGAPVARISLIDEDRQWFLSRTGGGTATETPRSQSVCSDVVAAQAPLTVRDLSDRSGEARYADLPGVLPEDGLRAEELTPDASVPVLLRRALDEHEFVPFYQPVVDMRDGAIVGLESLVRWQHPTRGLLTPDAFLPAVETGTLALWMAQTMLERACQLLVGLRAAGLVLPRGVAVNLSGAQLSRPGLAWRVLERLGRHGLPPDVLTLEVTEGAEIVDLGVAHDELALMRAAGVRVVLDDFGVGWSNLTRLLTLPCTGLKIDRQLVTDMVGDPVREHMVASAVSLARTMGLDVVAEGVETEAVRSLLLELGCTHGQGWLFSRALPAADVPQALARHPARPLAAGVLPGPSA